MTFLEFGFRAKNKGQTGTCKVIIYHLQVKIESLDITIHFGWKKDHLVQRRKTFLYVAVYAKIFEIAEK